MRSLFCCKSWTNANNNFLFFTPSFFLMWAACISGGRAANEEIISRVGIICRKTTCVKSCFSLGFHSGHRVVLSTAPNTDFRLIVIEVVQWRVLSGLDPAVARPDGRAAVLLPHDCPVAHMLGGPRRGGNGTLFPWGPCSSCFFCPCVLLVSAKENA